MKDNPNPLSFQARYSPEDFLPASDAEKQSLVVMRDSVSFWKDGVRRLKKNKVAMASLIVVIIIMIFSFIVPVFYPYSYEEQIRGSEHLAPMEYSEQEQERIDNGESVFPHVLGTDKHGRDYAIRVMMGSRVSLIVGLVAAVIILVIGSLFGSIAAFFGGWVDIIMMRIVDIIYTIPDILLIVLLSFALKAPLEALSVMPGFGWIQVLGRNLISIFIVFALLYWGGHGAYGAKPDSDAQGERVRDGGAGARRFQCADYPKTSADELYRYADCHDDAADSVFDFYGELLKLPRSGRGGSDAVSGKSCQRRNQRLQHVPVPAVHPGGSDQFDYPELQSAGRRPARRV